MPPTSLRDLINQSKAPSSSVQQLVAESQAIAGDVSAVVSPVAPRPVEDAEARGIPELLKALESALDTPAIGNALADVLRHIDSFPETADLLRPEEIGQIVQACGQSYNIVVDQKNTRADKRRATNEKVTEAAGILSGIGFGA